MGKVAVLGAGSWGTALSIVLADNDHEVALWSHREEQVEQINNDRENKQYLEGIQLDQLIHADTNLEKIVKDADAILFVVPTKAIRQVCQQVKPYVTSEQTIIHASKGIEPETNKRISEMMAEELGPEIGKGIVVLSGPSHAEEVGRRQPTTVTVSSLQIDQAIIVQDLFMNENFRVYTNEDLVGVEIGGALKNIIALGAGISDGLGYGDNAKAALITRGLAEIARLGKHLDANPLTFAGLTGVGDLIVTCTSQHSRNWRAGNMLGKGYKLDDVLDQMGMVVEGVRTTKAAYQMSKKLEVNMPITEGLYELVVNDKPAKDVVDDLMNRSKADELEQISNG
ncbi:NAD(P)H-dependent glycerol-3-phosphate dehydrogenase [Alkalibacillus haloalkaliphilus]|uniref:NAD(P)H-dependent glycerol-3-phosphate dehydrogenase n=1 Tax=Alkalibacillus haloalkaliphilus TaxID=94136 RepID=UPI0029355D92|nr:NAD(P)H-dependent glycerol-3-phosphate dehydrogenase [Alkalibacillus haloalkaliphilus]MDV2580837.1 NAD(P)H-dependent glycerol-3-phosphate dehydrogenase [Alkalibacillus haloalkaliphilus]